MPAYAQHLHTWGEAGTVTIKTTMMPKVRDRGVQCMFVGYAVKHPGDTYRMWDPVTGGIHETRDIIWLRRMYYGKPLTPGTPLLSFKVGEGEGNMEENESDDTSTAEEEEIESNESSKNENNDDNDDKEDVEEEKENEDEEEDVEDNEEPAEQLYATRCGRIVNPRHCLIKETETGFAAGTPLGMSSELGLMMAERNFYACMREAGLEDSEVLCVGAALGRGFENTKELHVMKYNQAINQGDPKEQAAWKQAVKEEYE
jgi:hypothetical protein